ncbi:ABC transporter ATP-binding protein [Alicyclobacillus fastidiosus]|uniref:ABC transporter ATP-binding protein n=1 Tax=Alicyclobacillus fastidiosus TaxID=392011 RepID=A0ABV5AKU4_9BACL|nr:ABC transporter ATP-binding protein [Alicyclobacillus fastidiosus]WEH08289.1 ABC transporter ATP-binding protein [Alicyclobacillus fastidiosus]
MLELQLKLPRRSFTVSVDLRIQTNSIFCLFGPSATGKSSILSVIAGFETDYEDVYLAIDGEVLANTNLKSGGFCPPWRRGIGYMEQSARLFPHLTVEQNILYGVARRPMDRWSADIIDFLDLRDYLSVRPRQLSGGLTQRVALARALAAKPRVLLLDEPFSALDWMARRALQDLVLTLHQSFPMTIVLVTHQLTEAQRMADTIALMDRGQILQTGSPGDLMASPSSWRAAQLLGYASLFRDSDDVQYAIHPDRIVVGRQPNHGITVDANVHQVIWHEGHQRAVLLLKAPWQTEQMIEVNLAPTDNVQVGAKVPITFVHPPQIG